MNEFYEQFITKDYGILPKIMQKIFYLLLIFSVLSFFTLYITIGIFLIILAFFIELICRIKFLEYEYEYFDGELTISKIINKKSRKIIANIKINKISKIVTPCNIEKSMEIVNACFKGIENNTEIIFVVNHEGKTIGYYLSLDEHLFKILRKENPFIFNKYNNYNNVLGGN